MYWTLELASKLEDAPWPATKDELIDFAIRSGAPMEVVENLYAGYGDGPPRGEGVYQAMAIARGQEYFEEEFPELDRITTATILEGSSRKPN